MSSVDWDKYNVALGRALDQGLDYIRQNGSADAQNPKKAVFDISNGFNAAAALTQEARNLEAALRNNVKHEGPSYGDALMLTFLRAADRPSVSCGFEDKKGVLVDRPGAARLVLKF